MPVAWKYFLPVFVFIILAALDFAPMRIPAWMTFPLLWLTLCASAQRQWALAACLFFSFMGDAMGWQHKLIPQIGFFALTQILYIIIYSRLLPPRTCPERGFDRGLLSLLAVVFLGAMLWIFPQVEDRFVAYGIAVYATLLLGMCFAATRHRETCLCLGAVLFVASDFILAIDLFVCSVPSAHLCIMIPYFAGQLLLFLGTQKLYSQGVTK